MRSKMLSLLIAGGLVAGVAGIAGTATAQGTPVSGTISTTTWAKAN
jgi:hypothetical protein